MLSSQTNKQDINKEMSKNHAFSTAGPDSGLKLYAFHWRESCGMRSMHNSEVLL